MWATEFVIEQAIDEHSLPVFVEVLMLKWSVGANWREVRPKTASSLSMISSSLLINLASSLRTLLPPAVIDAFAALYLIIITFACAVLDSTTQIRRNCASTNKAQRHRHLSLAWPDDRLQ
jgi:hypothetical protein